MIDFYVFTLYSKKKKKQLESFSFHCLNDKLVLCRVTLYDDGVFLSLTYLYFHYTGELVDVYFFK